jgi:ABC-type polysaccharide/polyol phosphate export permease
MAPAEGDRLNETVSECDGAPAYDSARRPPPFLEELIEAWRYRDLIRQFVSRDIKVRYKRSVLGVAWTMLNPLLMMVVLAVVFSHLFRFDLPRYPVYLLGAIVLWNFFAQTTTAAMSQLVWGGGLMTRIYMPRTVFAFSALGTGLVNLLLALVPLAGVMMFMETPFRLALFTLPVAVGLAAMFALGVGLVLSSLAVSFPDIIDMYQVMLSILYFFTPIFYPRSALPEWTHTWLNLNPMYHMVEIFRAPIYGGCQAGPNTWLAAIASSGAALLAGWFLFTSRAEKIVYRV